MEKSIGFGHYIVYFGSNNEFTDWPSATDLWPVKFVVFGPFFHKKPPYFLYDRHDGEVFIVHKIIYGFSIHFFLHTYTRPWPTARFVHRWVWAMRVSTVVYEIDMQSRTARSRCSYLFRNHQSRIHHALQTWYFVGVHRIKICTMQFKRKKRVWIEEMRDKMGKQE